MAEQFYDLNSLAYFANINMALLGGKLRRVQLGLGWNCNRFKYTTFTAPQEGVFSALLLLFCLRFGERSARQSSRQTVQFDLLPRTEKKKLKKFGNEEGISQRACALQTYEVRGRPTTL